jgi:hypothetical protein
MQEFHARDIEHAKQLAERMRQPLVKGSLDIVCGKLKLSMQTEGMDGSGTANVLKAAFDAAMRAVGPQYIITVGEPRDPGKH